MRRSEASARTGCSSSNLLLAGRARAQPAVLQGQRTRSRLRVVIDGSASMQTPDERPAASGRARRGAKWVVMGRGEQMMVLLAGGTTRGQAVATTDKAAAPRLAVRAVRFASPRRRAAHRGRVHLRKRGEEEVSTGESSLQRRRGAGTGRLRKQELAHLSPHRPTRKQRRHRDARRARESNPSQRAVFTSVANYSTNTHKPIWASLRGSTAETRRSRSSPRDRAAGLRLATATGMFHLRLTKDDLEADSQNAPS